MKKIILPLFLSCLILSAGQDSMARTAARMSNTILDAEIVSILPAKDSFVVVSTRSLRSSKYGQMIRMTAASAISYQMMKSPKTKITSIGFCDQEMAKEKKALRLVLSPSFKDAYKKLRAGTISIDAFLAIMESNTSEIFVK